MSAKEAIEVTVSDSAMTREVLRDIARRPVDFSGLDVHVMHGVVYMKGRLDKLRGYYEDVDLHEEVNIIIRMLRQKLGIHDVCCEIEFGEPSLHERMSPHPRKVA